MEWHAPVITVKLWRLELGWVQAARDRQVLSSAERDRADRFVRPRDAARFMAVRAELRRRLGEATRRAPTELDIVADRHGKPRVLGSGVFFNVSHSHDTALIALSHEADVGVDFERVQPIEDSVIDTFFSDGERQALGFLPEDDRLRGIYRVWCRKEALLKGIGIGLTVPLDALSVSLGPEADVVWTWNGAAGDWRLSGVETGDDYEAALAVRSEGRPVRLVVARAPVDPGQA